MANGSKKRSDGGSRSAAAAPPPLALRLRQWFKCLLLMAVGSLLIGLSFAPVYLFPLAWVGLVPWFMGVNGLSGRRAAFLGAWLVGTIYFALSMSWIIGVTAAGWLALAIYCGLYWAVPAAIFHGMGWLRPVRQAHVEPRPHFAVLNVLLIAATWTALEWVRGTFLTGLAWGFLGHSQTVLLVLCQIADTTGVYGVTFWLVMLNAAIYLTLQVRPVRSLAWMWLLAGGSTLLLVAYGRYRLATTVTYPGPTVMVVQSNYPQSNTGAKGADLPTIVKFHLDQTQQSLARQPAGSVDLVAWSETMMPPFDQENLDALPRFAGTADEIAALTADRMKLSKLAAENDMALIVGGQYSARYTPDSKNNYRPERRNSAYFFTRSGELSGRYDKIHLVPFGEFVPFKESFPWLHDLLVSLGPPDMNAYALASGSDLTVFTLQKPPADPAATQSDTNNSPAGDPAAWRFVTPICFEDLDARLVAGMFRGDDGGKRAQFMVNLTNDGWFNRNENADHFQMAVFRCIENRAPLARAVNTGISGFIDSTGRASNRLPVRTEGAAVRRLALDPRVTFYTRYGDVFAVTCLLLATVAVSGRIGGAFWKRRLAMKRAALLWLGIVAMGGLWACQSTATNTGQQAQLTKPNDPDPPPPLVPTPIQPELQSRARAQLIAAAESTDPVVRTNALAAMVDSMGAEAAPQFLAALDDQDATARFTATIAVGRLKLEAAHDKLLVLAVGGDPSVNVGAIFALHCLGDYRYSHELETTAFSTNPTVKADTAVVFGLMDDSSAAPYLAILLSDPDIGVQLQAAAAFWRLRDQRGLDVLSAKLISKYPDDEIFALDALAEPRDPRVRGQIRGQLSTWPPEVQLTAARALGMLHSDAGYSLGIKYATSTDETQRVFAAEALGAIGRPDAQTTLAKLMDDPSAQVKLAAAAAIIQLGQSK